MVLKEVLGQEEAVSYLKAILKKGAPSSLIFVGPEGVGKRKTALSFAKALNCEKGGCNICNSCSYIERRIHPDVKIVEPKGASIKIDSIRNLAKEAYIKPVYEAKVYIIDSAEMFTSEAASCILKILEEPPQFLRFILITTSVHNLLPTIRSRCQIVRFKRLPQELQERIVSSWGIKEDDARVLLQFSCGNLGKAFQYKEYDLSYEKERAALWLDNLEKRSVLQMAEELLEKKEQIQFFLDLILSLLRQRIFCDEDLQKIEAVIRAKEMVLSHLNQRTVFDNMVFEMRRKR
jgi:DNA polymerase-3 subunit delta'